VLFGITAVSVGSSEALKTPLLTVYVCDHCATVTPANVVMTGPEMTMRPLKLVPNGVFTVSLTVV
jgi:hypothetical protein